MKPVLTCGILLPLLFAAGCGMTWLRVTDDSDGSPVEGAELRCTMSGQAGEKSIAATDSGGRAVFFPPRGIQLMIVSKPGYQTFSKPFDSLPRSDIDYTIDIRLVPVGQERTEFPK